MISISFFWTVGMQSCLLKNGDILENSIFSKLAYRLYFKIHCDLVNTVFSVQTYQLNEESMRIGELLFHNWRL